MTFIADSARETLKVAQTDFIKARRNLWLAVGLLALIHVLTVYPYLETSRDIAHLNLSSAGNAQLLAQLDPEMERLKSAGKEAGDELRAMLDDATQEMIDDFAVLRELVKRAQEGDVPDAAELSGATVAQPQTQVQQMNLNVQAPPEIREPGEAVLASTEEEVAELMEVLKAIADNEPDAQDQLRNYARRNIVERAYAEVQRDWSEDVRPVYLEAMSIAEKQAHNTADQAIESAPDTATKLRRAADELAAQRTVVEEIEISPDSNVNAALGTEWWRTVAGKGHFADAVSDSVRKQLAKIDDLATSPSDTIKRTLELQGKLRDELHRKQQELKQRFDEQHKQLATLSGASGILPVDLASFIALFPLLLGLVLGFLMLRSGQVRREAAIAAADLAVAAPQDRETRIWLARRVLGSTDARGPQLMSAAFALGVIAWVALAAIQVQAGDMTPPLAPWASAALAAIIVVAAAAWDVMAIQRLAEQVTLQGKPG